MTTDLGVGDSEIPLLDVQPADTDTAVALTVEAPDGTSSTIPMGAGALAAIAGTSPVEYSQRWTGTVPVSYDQAGRWVLHYTVTGTGEGAEDLEVFVVQSPTAGGPTWQPGRTRVALYVPHRTLVRSDASTVASADTYEMTFDADTIPTGVQCDRLIADGVAWVSSRVYPMHSTSEAAAGVCAAIYAAAMIERSWPNDDQSLQRANDLEKRLDTMLADLVRSNEIANGEDITDDYGLDIAYPYDPNSIFLTG